MVFSTTFNAVALLAVVPAVTAQWGSVGGIDVTMCSGYMLRLDEMNTVCCSTEPGGVCANGFPTECSPPCAGIFGNFNDDCEGMFSYLGMTSNPDYMEFAAKCEDGHEPSGLSTSMGGTAVVQFELDTDDAEGDIPEGAVIHICGTFNSWCTYNEGIDESPQAAAPVVMTRGQGFADNRDWYASVNLNPGTYAYKYQIVPDPAHPGDHTWEDVPEECGVAWDRGFDRVLTVTSSVNSQFAYGSGVTIFDVFSDCGDGPTDCELNLTHEPALDATFLGEADERTGNHEMTLTGDAHVEADGVHFDGDGDCVSFPTFDYYDAKPGKQAGDFGSDSPSFSLSMWVNTDVCDPEDPTPSTFGYVYSHNQDSTSHPLAADNSNINIYQGCGNGGYMRFVFVGATGFASYDIPFTMLDEGGNLEDVTYAQFGFTFSGNTITMYVNGLQLMYDFQLAPGAASVAMGAVAGPAWTNAATPNGGQVNLNNLNNGAGIGRFRLLGDIYIGGRADQDEDRFYTGAIAGLQIFTDGASAADFQCIYNHQEEMVLGTTAHTCTFHAEGYRWLDPTTDPRAERLSEVCDSQSGACNFASGATGELRGSPDDGYFYMNLQPLGITFPFMGRVEHELYISANGYISFSGDQTGDSGQASNPETTVIPSAGAKPDDAIFAYWTDLDLSNGGEVYIAPESTPGEGTTITWLDAPYYCHGAGEGEWSSEPDYGEAWHTGTNCIGKTASFQVTLFGDGRIKIQYKDIDTYASPAWAPVSIGLESADGFDGIQVAYDDHDWPRSGTAIGFSASCATAGENDCGADDLARATVSCLTFDTAHPECAGGYGAAPQSCATTFCEDACYAELANLHDDCINNPRANIDADDQQTILQLAPPQLLQLCSGPDSGTVAPPGGGGH